MIADRLSSFLGLPFAAEMLKPEAMDHPGQQTAAALDGGTWLDPALGLRAIEPSRITGWERELTPAAVAAVNEAFRDHAELSALGYRLG